MLTCRRLNRLEQTVSALVERLDRGDGFEVQNHRWAPEASNTPLNDPPLNNSPPGTPSAAPMFLIRDAASQAGVRHQDRFLSTTNQSHDIISKGLVTVQESSTMIELYVTSFLERFPPFGASSGFVWAAF